jgi:hypothetical protein
LLPNSEAIDAGDGDSTTTDQRGFAVSGPRDIGAFEAFVPIVVAPMNVSVEATGPLTSPDLGAASVSDVDETGLLIATASQSIDFAEGITTVTWSATDSYGFIGTDTQTVTIIADIPVANNDSYSTNEDNVLTADDIDGTGTAGSNDNGVLTNDNDPDNDGLTVVTTGISTMTGMGGSLNMSIDGTFIYTPVADVSGTDVLNYEITDGTHTVVATITIEVNPVNDAPTFTVMGDVDVTGLVDAMNDFVEVPDFIENIVLGPIDESAQSIDSITVNEMDPDNVINTATIDTNGLLRVDINIGNYGTAIIQVQLKDDGGTANSGDDTSQIVEFMLIYDDLIFGSGFEDTIELP